MKIDMEKETINIRSYKLQKQIGPYWITEMPKEAKVIDVCISANQWFVIAAVSSYHEPFDVNYRRFMILNVGENIPKKDYKHAKYIKSVSPTMHLSDFPYPVYEMED